MVSSLSRRVRGAGPVGPGAPAGVLLAGGADDGPDVEVGGPSRETHLLPRPQPEQVPPPTSHSSTSSEIFDFLIRFSWVTCLKVEK